jgi:hypothetical protein
MTHVRTECTPARMRMIDYKIFLFPWFGVATTMKVKQ